MKPIVSEYELSEEQAAHFRGMMVNPSAGTVVSAARITYDGDADNGYLAVFGVTPNDFGDIYWADYMLFSVSGVGDDGYLAFRFNMIPMGDLDKGDAFADGFCKWDGCREIRTAAHVCNDGDMERFLRALAVAVATASRLAGYEGDGKR